ncbi:MAG: hypothetical protein ACK4J0_02705 [Candidatus Anstonellaceae archaeon]
MNMEKIKNKNKKQKEEENTLVKKKIFELVFRSRRAKKGVNLSKIEVIASKTKEDGIFVVPDKVLGAGKLTKPITICALGYSKSALEALIKSSCQILEFSKLNEMLKQNKKIFLVR